MKKLLLRFIFVFIISQMIVTNVYADNEYIDIMKDIQNVEEYEDLVEMENINLENKDKHYYNINNYKKAVGADFVGFRRTKTPQKGMKSYARTSIEPFGIKMPQWKINVRGDLFKNYHLYSGAPSTTRYVDVLVETPIDSSAKKGDYYEFNSFHRVYDYDGIKIWDKSHVRRMTY